MGVHKRERTLIRGSRRSNPNTPQCQSRDAKAAQEHTAIEWLLRHVRLLRLLKGTKVFYQTVNLIRCLPVRTFRLPHIYTTNSKRASSVQLRIAPGSTGAQDPLHIRTEKIMNTRILDMTIPEVPGVFAAAMA